MVDIAKPLSPAGSYVSKFGPNVRLPHIIEVKVSAEQLIAAKGTALAAADVFDVFKVVPGTIVKGVWLKKTKAHVGSSTDLALDVGITAVDADYWVDGYAFDDLAVGTIAPVAAGAVAVPFGYIAEAATTITVLIQAMTGTWTSGSFVLYIELLDLTDSKAAASIAQLGS